MHGGGRVLKLTLALWEKQAEACDWSLDQLKVFLELEFIIRQVLTIN